MSGAGFLRSTQSPAKIVNSEAVSVPSNVSTRFWTAFSLDVEQTATVFPASMAERITRSTPGRSGTVPSRMSPLKTSVLAKWSSLTRACLISSCRSARGAGQPTAFQWAVMRSLPPPTSSSLPYPSTVHSVSRERSAKTRLKATLWASRSVSAKTPSISHRMASRDGAGSLPLAAAAASAIVVVFVEALGRTNPSAKDAESSATAVVHRHSMLLPNE
mmetsp:Transcript_12242/g.34984  ORF Transcript_12242/g.34984 Transcript_12242/m.34984 type:complete len:217 (+) Transcript_12242:617-1267(+)